MLIRQAYRYDEMTHTHIKLRDDHSGDVQLLQGNLTTLLYLRLIFTVLGVL